jgi:uncharacterized protein YfdQ (DUF2303 family)
MDNPALNNRDDAPAVVEAAELGRRIAVATATPRKGSYQDAGEFIVLRNAAGDERIEWIMDTCPAPERKTGTVALDDADSFLAYWKSHQEGGHIYARMLPAVEFTAVLNDHQSTAPGYRDHRAVFKVSHSPEWNVWTEHNGRGKPFNDNEALALFLQDNLPDIAKPEPAKMLQIATNFRVKQDIVFNAVQRLQDGNMDIGYTNTVDASAGSDKGGKLTIPETFTIKIPVFAGLGASLYDIEARFRYRMQDRKAILWYELVRPHKVVELAFSDLVKQITKSAGTPILFGAPSK